MLTLNVNKANQNSNLTALDLRTSFITRAEDTCWRTTAWSPAHSWWYWYWTIVETVGSTQINWYLWIFENPSVFHTNWTTGALMIIQSYWLWSTAAQVRLATPIAAREWMVLSGATIVFHDFISAWWWTGTLKVRLLKMNTSWTLSQVWEWTTTVVWPVGQKITVRVPSTTPQTIAAGDRIVIEIDVVWNSSTTSVYVYARIYTWFNTALGSMIYIY